MIISAGAEINIIFGNHFITSRDGYHKNPAVEKLSPTFSILYLFRVSALILSNKTLSKYSLADDEFGAQRPSISRIL